MMESTAEIMSRGMKCLVEQMGIVEAERFISVVIREKFDYTKWSRYGIIIYYQVTADMTAEETFERK